MVCIRSKQQIILAQFPLHEKITHKITKMKAVLETKGVTLVSFADSRMLPTLRRLHGQAKAMESLERTLLYTERDLRVDFKAATEEFLKPGIRGFGYWVWKPEVVLMALGQIEDGEILCYCDAGFHLNPKGEEHLRRYISPILSEQAELVAFAHNPALASFPLAEGEVPRFLESQYTKGDMLDFWSARSNEAMTKTPQYASGLFFVRKTTRIISLFEKWRDDAVRHRALFDDSPSISPNLPDFVENRHDQSYFSLMCKANDHHAFSAFEFWLPSREGLKANWSKLEDFPFHAKRDKSFGGIRGYLQPLYRIVLKGRRSFGKSEAH